MPNHEHRRVSNQPQPVPARSRAEWEQFRRALLMVVAQFKATDPDGCYTLSVQVATRDRSAEEHTPLAAR